MPERTPRRSADWATLTARIEPDLLERLERAADERVVGRNLLVNAAIGEYLDRLRPVEELCTAVEATWCGVHGQCICGQLCECDHKLDDHDLTPSGTRCWAGDCGCTVMRPTNDLDPHDHRDNPRCPLHAHDSPHGEAQ